ncbi:MAG: hydroxyacylglutathione hydrolase [Candidatus Poribacteria bacterium]|nr:hydroxyacylglutathione hydrolase [Candidatus Poribacteria bacterium]
MIVHTLTLGSMQANCYLLECEETHSAIVIDPGDDAEVILDILEKRKLNLEFIINTHGHIDHISANADLKKKTSAKLYIHRLDADMIINPQKNLSSFIGRDISSPSADKILEDGDNLEVGTIILKVIHTPGHSPGSICLLADESVFTGDLLFAGSIGRYDFPGSSYNQIISSLKMIMELDDDLVVYSGHGPITTIGEERNTNPFITNF